MRWSASAAPSSARSNAIPSADASSLPASPSCPATETFALMDRTRDGEKQLELQAEQAYALGGENRWGGERQWIYSSVASPAKISPSPGDAPASAATAVPSSGRSSVLRSSRVRRGASSKTRSEEHTSELQSLRHLVCRS